jgi:phenylacetate-CoA ligase
MARRADMTAMATTSIELLRARMAACAAVRVPSHLERLGWSAGQLADFQQQRLRALLRRAMDRSPFHTARLAGINPGEFELADLSLLPVMTKAQMLASFDQIVTDKRLTRDVVERHLACSAVEPSLLLGDYVCLVSGGSSGLRGLFVQTAEEYAEFGGAIKWTTVATLMASGAPPPDDIVIGLVGAASPVHSSGFGVAVGLGPPARLVGVPATLPVSEIVERLNAAQPYAMIGYASKLAQLADEQREGRLRIAPLVVTSVTEPLTSGDRHKISGAFGVPVTDMFVSTEGLVGSSEPGQPVITLASDLCIAECVDSDNNPVPDGTEAAKVLITNLHNRTQPLIRYELNDRFVPAGISANGSLRATVAGRAEEVFRYGAVQVHPHVFVTALLAEAAVREYQVRQTKTGAEIAIVAERAIDEAAVTAAIVGKLRRSGVAGPAVTIRRVDAIARDLRTAKSRRFIPLES